MYLALPSVRGRDKSLALRAVFQNMRVSPRSAVAHYWAASVCAADMRLREAAVHLDFAVRLQPDVLFFHTRRAVALWWAGQSEAAIRHLHDIVTVDPHDPIALHWLGQVCAHTGRYDEACDAATRANERCPTPSILGGLGWVEAMAGHVASARAILDTLTQLSRQQFVATSRLAALEVALGDQAAAAATFARGLREGDWHLAWAACDPRWERLRGRVAAA
jgi:Flp pilus assembly protein TadD